MHQTINIEHFTLFKNKLVDLFSLSDNNKDITIASLINSGIYIFIHHICTVLTIIALFKYRCSILHRYTILMRLKNRYKPSGSLYYQEMHADNFIICDQQPTGFANILITTPFGTGPNRSKII